MAPGLRCRALTSACSGIMVRGKESGHPTDCSRQSRQQTVRWMYLSPPARQAGQEGSNSLRSIRRKRYLLGSPAELASPATSIATLRCEIVPGQAGHKLPSCYPPCPVVFLAKVGPKVGPNRKKPLIISGFSWCREVHFAVSTSLLPGCASVQGTV